MFWELYRKMPVRKMMKIVQWIYRHTFPVVNVCLFYLLFVPRRLFMAITDLLLKNTDHECEETNNQQDVSTCSTTKNGNYQIDDTDEFYCEYDSTWETNSSRPKETSRRTRRHQSFRFSCFRQASRDMQLYRHNYPAQHAWSGNHQKNATPNLDFYLGKRRSLPDDFSIKEVHEEWFGDYERLENVHTFIQWLFPLQEPGMNYHAIELTKEEIQAFKKNQTAKENLLASYSLMLDFYGLKLSNVTTGEVMKSPKWQDRFKNLDRNTHNNLRITRILKCLGTLGYRHYQAPLVRFFLEETLVNHRLPNVKDSVLNYFMFTVLDKQKRRELIEYAYKNFDESEFVWCPKVIQMEWSKEKENRSVTTCHQNTEPSSSDEEEKNEDLKQDRTVHRPPSRRTTSKYLTDEEENNEYQANVYFKQASPVNKTSHLSGQPRQKYSSDEEEKNEDLKQDRTVHRPPSRRTTSEYLTDEEENNEYQAVYFKQASPVNKTSHLSGQPRQKYSSDEEEKNEDLKQSSPVYQRSAEASRCENYSEQEHSPGNYSIDPTDSDASPSASSTINSGQKTDGGKTDESHAYIQKHPSF